MQTSFYYWAIGAAATLAVLTTGYYFVFGTPGDLSTLMVEERVSERECTEEELLDPTVDCVRPQLVMTGLEDCAEDQGIDASVSCLAEVDPELMLEADEHPLIDVEETENGYVLILPGGVREEIIDQPLSQREQLIQNLQGDWKLTDVQVKTRQNSGSPLTVNNHQLGGILRISGNRWFFDEKPSVWDTSHCEVNADAALYVSTEQAQRVCAVRCEVTGPDWMYGVINPQIRTNGVGFHLGSAITLFGVPEADRDQPKFKMNCFDAAGNPGVKGDAINPLLLTIDLWGMDIWANGQGITDPNGDPWISSPLLSEATIDSLVLQSVANYGDDIRLMTFTPVR